MTSRSRITPVVLASLAVAALAVGGTVLLRQRAERPAAVAKVDPVTGVPRRVDPGLLHVFQPPSPTALAAQAAADTDAQVQLGRMLFFDKRLSKNHDLSCSSCHGLDTYGMDGQRVSLGHRKQKGRRNTPTVLHAGEHVAQFWDGRALTLEEQAEGPLLNPVEMAMPSPARIVDTLRSMPGYVKHFKAAFPSEKQPVHLKNVGRALAAFQRKLVTHSRFDRYLAGDAAALSEQELAGLERFVTTGCPACHNGPAVGGTSLQKLGLLEDYPAGEDQGRFDVTRDEEDRMKFRVPSLRNVAKTAPYFHDGSIDDLETAVRLMGRHQLGQRFTKGEVAELVAFLESLTGELPPELAAPPELPASTPRTPKPDPS